MLKAFILLINHLLVPDQVEGTIHSNIFAIQKLAPTDLQSVGKVCQQIANPLEPLSESLPALSDADCKSASADFFQ